MNCLEALIIVCLWKQVLEVVNKMPSLRKISFLAHSLGGLFARYVIAILHSVSVETKNAGQSSALIVPTTRGPAKSRCASGLGSIAGLRPINFITLATPHLGVRGRNQVHHQNVSDYVYKIYCTLSSKGSIPGKTNSLFVILFIHVDFEVAWYDFYKLGLYHC
jgi:hypothetical protein